MSAKQPIQKWEYSVFSLEVEQRFNDSDNDIDPDKYEAELDQLGAEGWELVSAFPMIGPGGLGGPVCAVTLRIGFAMKRPVRE